MLQNELPRRGVSATLQESLENYLVYKFKLDKDEVSRILTDDFLFKSWLKNTSVAYFRSEFSSLWRTPLLRERNDEMSPLPSVFITGFKRSGTTILQRILLEHPSVWGLFEESHLFTSAHTDNEIRAVFSDWEKQAVEKNKQVILEKTPEQINYWYRIFALLPNVKLIFCLRDGRENVAAVMEMFRHPVERTVSRWLYELNQYEIAQRAFPDQVRLVYLRDLQSQPQQTLESLLNFIGIDSGAAILSLLLSYHERPRSLRSPFNIDLSEAGKDAPPKDAPEMAYQRWQANLPLHARTRDWTPVFSEEQYPELHEKMRPALIKYGFID